MKRQAISLIGDGIENPYNHLALKDAAAMFGSPYLFCRSKQHKSQRDRGFPHNFAPPREIKREIIFGNYCPLIALENIRNASPIYGYQLPQGEKPALIVGNERFGIGKDIISAATDTVHIPLFGRGLNTLNVASASAVAMYYLSIGGGGNLRLRNNPAKKRPEIALVGACEHAELGSAIRTAGAMGWGRLFIEDRENVWFGVDRIKRSEGRAAARRGRNAIRLIPITHRWKCEFNEVLILTTTEHGIPIQKSDLSKGPAQLIIIPDEKNVSVNDEDWRRFGGNVKFVRINIPMPNFPYRYRLVASIVLAEVYRQVGHRRRPVPGRPQRHEPLYDHAINLIMDREGERVYLDELTMY